MLLLPTNGRLQMMCITIMSQERLAPDWLATSTARQRATAAIWRLSAPTCAPTLLVRPHWPPILLEINWEEVRSNM